MQSAAAGGERRGREWGESNGFAPQRLVCQRKHIFRKVFVQARPGKEGGHGKRRGGRHNNSMKPTTLSRIFLRFVSLLVRISSRIVPLRQPCGGLSRSRYAAN